MLDDTKLLIKVMKHGEWFAAPAKRYGFASEYGVASKDGQMGLYQSVKGIIWDCDKRPLDIQGGNVNS